MMMSDFAASWRLSLRGEAGPFPFAFLFLIFFMRETPPLYKVYRSTCGLDARQERGFPEEPAVHFRG